MPGGNLGEGVVVEVGDAFRGIQTLDEQQGHLRVGAGETGQAIAKAADRLGGFLPFLPSSARWCTLGGMIANNAAGARSFRYGSIRSHVEALEGIYAWGETFRVARSDAPSERFARLDTELRRKLDLQGKDRLPGWPRVRKNSSGYALDRFLGPGGPVDLLVGSEGTLAIVTRAELRVIPKPPCTGLMVAGVSSPEALTALALEATEVRASACEFFGRRFLELAGANVYPELRPLARDAFAMVVVEAMGTRSEVEARLTRLERSGLGLSDTITTFDSQAMDRLWAVRHAASPTIARESGRGRISTQFVEDCVVPVEALGSYLKELDCILTEAGLDAVVFGHAGDGNVHVNPLLNVLEADWRIRGSWPRSGPPRKHSTRKES
jgi:FAD/FMN-containing dehydrogenase